MLTGLRHFCFEYLSWAFQLKSLYTFNDKFGPTWSGRYVAFRDLKQVGPILMAIIQSEDPIVPPGFGSGARKIWEAVRRLRG